MIPCRQNMQNRQIHRSRPVLARGRGGGAMGYDGAQDFLFRVMKCSGTGQCLVVMVAQPCEGTQVYTLKR